jgi:hypothetical protein
VATEASEASSARYTGTNSSKATGRLEGGRSRSPGSVVWLLTVVLPVSRALSSVASRPGSLRASAPMLELDGIRG